jgi:hypothetical protein
MIRFLAIHALVAAISVGVPVAASPVEMTQADCERSAGIVGRDMSTAAIPHFCYGTHKGEVQVLLACTGYKIDFNKQCWAWARPLDMAAAHASEPMLRALIAAGANPKTLNSVGWTAIYAVVNACGMKQIPREQCFAALKLLKDAGVDVNKPDPHGGSPLWWSLRFGDVGVLEDLIALGADINQERDWETPLDYATEMKLAKAVAVLEKHGAKRATGATLAMQKLHKQFKYYSNSHWGH